ncbi:MAG: hypothetical protein Q9165_003501 [Trypethelium subeluteriae]
MPSSQIPRTPTVQPPTPSDAGGKDGYFSKSTRLSSPPPIYEDGEDASVDPDQRARTRSRSPVLEGKKRRMSGLTAANTKTGVASTSAGKSSRKKPEPISMNGSADGHLSPQSANKNYWRELSRSPSPLGLIPIHREWRIFIHKHEVPRKILHVSIGFLTLGLYATEIQPAQIDTVLMAMLIPIATTDVIRHNFPSFNRLYIRVLGALMRESEVEGWNGVIWYLLGTFSVLRFCPKDVGVMSILLLSWCDTAASTFGRLWGRYTPRVRRGKSLAGSIAAMITGIATAALFWGVVAPAVDQSVNEGSNSFAYEGQLSLPSTIKPLLGLRPGQGTIVGNAALGLMSVVAGFIASASEAIDLFGLDDNLTIPVLCGAAPKPAIDIKHIRQNPGLYSQNCVDRNYKNQQEYPWRILQNFEAWQGLQKDTRELRQRNNEVQRRLASVASVKRDALDDNVDSPDKNKLHAEARQLKDQINQIESKESMLQDEMESLALDLPNLSSRFTPSGDKPDLVEYLNEHPESLPSSSDRIWRSHVHVGSELQLLDFAAAANTSGWGWYFLVNEAVLLEQALVQYALSIAMKRGWKLVSPPSITYSHIAAACGFQPRDQNDEQQIYTLTQATKDAGKPSLCLSGTAEIPLAGMKAAQVLEEVDLPMKVIGTSRCYRAEAGARGVDTKGLYRVHEFTKVEMFAWTSPDEIMTEGLHESEVLHSTALFEEMVAIQKEILQGLGLHCRVLEMPSADLGASATRKRDIETFFPSRREKNEGWGEVTSASICTDYQSRRLATKLRRSKGPVKHDWPHTVNGTALAVPRVLAAILEYGWDEQTASVAVPKALQPYMGGMEAIRKHR